MHENNLSIRSGQFSTAVVNVGGALFVVKISEVLCICQLNVIPKDPSLSSVNL